ncbi:MAG: hypothetical protein CFH27_01076 [Alphaproteobacteria bacterium MarineAlpha6_Bin5]|nr:MAG: hypothetical protein CFH27_01076 [Alphaproteobacteria bacterium MarineAlpha6_Bin5]
MNTELTQYDYVHLVYLIALLILLIFFRGIK